MRAIAKLRMIGSGSKPYLGFSKLSVGYHKIECFRLVKNKFAKKNTTGDEEKSILVELEDQVIILPQYFLSVLDKDGQREGNR